MTHWRYYYRRYLGWLPVQFCMMCGRWYWGGLPVFWYRFGKWQWLWMPSWMDYCSKKCCDEELEMLG